MLIWRTIYCKWLCTIQTISIHKGYPNRLVLASCKCGESFMTFLYTPFTCKTVQAVQWTDYIALVEFCLWLLGNGQLHTKIEVTNETTFSRDGMINTWNSNIWSLSNPQAYMEPHSQSCFWLTFGVMLLEAKSYLSAWHEHYLCFL
jgi:hypothetical protein